MNHRDRTVVETRCGAVRGSGTNSVAFRGIPYAEAPVGELRFAAPVPRKRWEGVLDATAFGPTPQRRPFDALDVIPEPSIFGDDVLNLNVFTPAPNLPSAKLPVLVWIHGGGYIGGSPASPWYDGKSFNARGIVTVSIGYRLGFEGFAYIEDAPAPANRGLLDQILALHWVRENIAQFGGDPDRVTIAGQSAGAGSVLCLMASPRARRLFHQVIAQSPATLETPVEKALERSAEFAARAGVPNTVAGWSSLPSERIDELVAEFPLPLERVPDVPTVMARQFASVSGTAGVLSALVPFSPVIDDDVLPTSVDRALASGASAEIPLLIGCTRNELTAMLKPMREMWRSYDPRAVLNAAGFPKLAAWSFVREHPELHDDTALVMGQLATAGIFHMPMIRRVQARLRARVAVACDIEAGVTVGVKKAPTWVYEFAWPKPSTGFADHCAEIPFVFNCLDDADVPRIMGTNSPPLILAATMHSDWVRFITTGQPGWNSWSEGNRGRIYGADEQGTVRTAKPMRLEIALLKSIRRD
ncbi:MAG: carboxylesterase family protein [Ancrocorticia sp.]